MGTQQAFVELEVGPNLLKPNPLEKSCSNNMNFMVQHHKYTIVNFSSTT